MTAATGTTMLVAGTFLRMNADGTAYVKVDKRVGAPANVSAIIGINEVLNPGARVWMLTYATLGNTYVIVGGSNFASQSAAIFPGTILAWGGDPTTPPEGTLACDFAEVPRARYPDLYAAIGDRYGAGDELLTFNVPDLIGFVIRY